MDERVVRDLIEQRSAELAALKRELESDRQARAHELQVLKAKASAVLSLRHERQRRVSTLRSNLAELKQLQAPPSITPDALVLGDDRSLEGAKHRHPNDLSVFGFGLGLAYVCVALGLLIWFLK